ncbi:MAG: 50S ribosomal protein L29 [Chloroflexota bacterium]
MKIEEIRALSPEELAKNLEKAHQELFNLRIRLATKQLVNHREIPRVKKEIARLNTILREKQLGLEVKYGNQS